MRHKVLCPHKNCGRCIGEFTCSDENDSQVLVLTTKPIEASKRTVTFMRKCPRCKKEIYIIMGIKDN